MRPQEYGNAGLLAPSQNLTFLKQDVWSGESTEFSTCFCGPGRLREAENASASAIDNVITNITGVSGVDETEYGEQSRAPSDHIPVSAQCTYIRKTDPKGTADRHELHRKADGLLDFLMGKEAPGRPRPSARSEEASKAVGAEPPLTGRLPARGDFQ